MFGLINRFREQRQLLASVNVDLYLKANIVNCLGQRPAQAAEQVIFFTEVVATVVIRI